MPAKVVQVWKQPQVKIPDSKIYSHYQSSEAPTFKIKDSMKKKMHG